MTNWEKFKFFLIGIIIGFLAFGVPAIKVIKDAESCGKSQKALEDNRKLAEERKILQNRIKEFVLKKQRKAKK